MRPPLHRFNYPTNVLGVSNVPARKTDSLHLSALEIRLLAQITKESGDIASADDFRSWAQTSVRKLFAHEALIAGLAHRDGDDISVDGLVSAGFPMRFIEVVAQRHGSFACPTLQAWFRQGRPQLFDPGDGGGNALPAAEEFEAFNLKNVAAHGVLSHSGEVATYFSFSQVPGALGERHSLMLELLAPHLHRAYLSARARGATAAALNVVPHITPCESLVLQRLCRRDSTKGIARALGRSENTVKHQIQSLLQKLGASDREEAVTTAICLKLLPDRRQAF